MHGPILRRIECLFSAIAPSPSPQGLDFWAGGSWWAGALPLPKISCEDLVQEIQIQVSFQLQVIRHVLSFIFYLDFILILHG